MNLDNKLTTPIPNPNPVNIDNGLDQRGQTVQGGQINVAGDVLGDIILNRLDPDNLRNQRNHAALRQMVRSFWIDDVLKTTLYAAGKIEVQLDLRTDLVNNQAWASIVRLSKQTQNQRSYPAHAIGHLFDEMNHLLLILGEPGSGKTTLLLELLAILLQRAEADHTYPTPVLLNLSSWAINQQRLGDWVVEELAAKYYIPHAIAQSWVAHDELILLLDGLDEVSMESRAPCVAAINRYRHDHLVAIAVCSRTTEYTSLPEPLTLASAVVIQPLTTEQVEAHLTATKRLALLRQVFKQNEPLRELAQSPLLLTIMATTCVDLTPADARDLLASDHYQQRLFDVYIEKMYARTVRTQSNIFDLETTVSGLTWLASNLSRHAQAVFLIEEMQPGWLQTAYQRWLYVICSRTLIGLVIGGTNAIMIGSLFALKQNLEHGWMIGFISGLISGISAAVAVSIVDGLRLHRQPGPHYVPGDRTQSHLLYYGVTIGAMSAIITWLLSPLIYFVWPEASAELGHVVQHQLFEGVGGEFRTVQLEQVLFAIAIGLYSLLGSIAFYWMSGGIRGVNHEISTFEMVELSWRPTAQVFWSGTVAAAIFVLFSGLLGGLTVGAAFGLIAGVVIGAISGLEKKVIAKGSPNQGIRLSGLHALLVGGITGIIFELAGRVILGSPYWFLLGSHAALYFGGTDVIQHFTLRLLLWGQGQIPWNYARFLDFTVDRIFLRKVGGGYIFIHRLIMEHFADLTDEDIARIAAGNDNTGRPQS